MEQHGEGTQYLREFAVLEGAPKDSNNQQSPIDADEVQGTQSMWQKLVQSTGSLTLMPTKGEQTVLKVTPQL